MKLSIFHRSLTGPSEAPTCPATDERVPSVRPQHEEDFKILKQFNGDIINALRLLLTSQSSPESDATELSTK